MIRFSWNRPIPMIGSDNAGGPGGNIPPVGPWRPPEASGVQPVSPVKPLAANDEEGGGQGREISDAPALSDIRPPRRAMLGDGATPRRTPAIPPGSVGFGSNNEQLPPPND